MIPSSSTSSAGFGSRPQRPRRRSLTVRPGAERAIPAGRYLPGMARRAHEVPARIEWALGLLDVAPADLVLELGCGTGVAAALVCDCLAGGCLTAIDRSATAISRARSRNVDHLESGRLVLEEVPLADRSATAISRARSRNVDVNLFWTTAADVECQVLMSVLAAHGVVHLVFDGPGVRGPDVKDRVAANLSRNGFMATVSHGPGPSLVCVTGRRRN